MSEEMRGWFKNLNAEQLREYRKKGIICYKCHHRSGIERYTTAYGTAECGFCGESIWAR